MEELKSDFISLRNPRSGLRALLIFFISTIVFWISIGIMKTGPTLHVEIILKFMTYLSSILWINSGFYLRELARGVNIDTREFQKTQVKLTLWIIGILILSELPLWITSFQAP